MRFSTGLPADRVDRPDEFGTAEAVAEVATAAERAGFDAAFVTEHPVPEERWLAGGGHQALDPFVALSFAAASTTTLRLQTNLTVLPYRNPLLTAKSVASLDLLSGGRVLLGVGAGYLKPEFFALGADFEDRNARTDAALVAMKRAWRGEPFEIEGPDGRLRTHRVLPRPRQQPHPPIWMGGNSRIAIRRAARHCQGWMPFPNPRKYASRVRTAPIETLDDLSERLTLLRSEADRFGREEPLDVMCSSLRSPPYGHPRFEAQALLDEIGAQADLGVTQMAVLFERPGGTEIESRRRLVELLEGFGAGIIARVRTG